MRVLVVMDVYRPSRLPSANRMAVLVEAMRAAGIDVRVLASTDSLLNASDDYEPPSYVTYYDTFPLQEKTLINRLKNNFGGQRESANASKSMGDFDVVLCTTPPLLLTTSAMKIARNKDAKLVLDVRDIWPDVAYEMGSFTPSSLYGRFFSAIARKGFARADLVTTVTPGKVERLKGRMPEGRQDAVRLIPNGIDEGFFDNSVDPLIVERLDLENGPICSFTGNIGLAQGLDTLLLLASERKDVRFLLFGEGADEVRLRQMIHDQGLANVEFCGVVGERAVYTVLSYSDLTYVPLVSSRLKDSVPSKMYEALACGCPILLAAADDGDAAVLLEESGLGKHAAPEDRDGLRKAFDEVLSAGYSAEQKDLTRRFVKEKHSRQVFAREFVELLKRNFGDGVQDANVTAANAAVKPPAAEGARA